MILKSIFSAAPERKCTTVDAGYKNTGYKNMTDIRTFYSKTVDTYLIQFMPVIRTLNAVPDDVLITGIHCIGMDVVRRPYVSPSVQTFLRNLVDRFVPNLKCTFLI